MAIFFATIPNEIWSEIVVMRGSCVPTKTKFLIYCRSISTFMTNMEKKTRRMERMSYQMNYSSVIWLVKEILKTCEIPLVMSKMQNVLSIIPSRNADKLIGSNVS